MWSIRLKVGVLCMLFVIGDTLIVIGIDIGHGRTHAIMTDWIK